jgi:predicted ferric reductase
LNKAVKLYLSLARRISAKPYGSNNNLVSIRNHVGCATANILIGLMIFGRYSPVRYWPHRRFDVFRIHRWTGYSTLGFTLLHPLPLLLNGKPHFRALDIAFPVWSPLQPLWNTIGAVALYLLVVIVVTSVIGSSSAAISGNSFITSPMLPPRDS